MSVHLSPEVKHKLCELIMKNVEKTDRKIYPTLARVKIKGPAFYAYLNRESVPSEEVTPKLISLALILDREGTIEIIRGELEDFSKFVEGLVKLTTTSIAQVQELMGAITGLGRKGRTSVAKRPRSQR